MAKKRKPKNLNALPMALHVVVTHPETEERAKEGDDWGDMIDAEGHRIAYNMMHAPGEWLAVLYLRRGVSPSATSSLLRKIAGLIDTHGGKLLNMTVGNEGNVKADGTLEADSLQCERDDNGQIIIPDIIDPTKDEDAEGRESGKTE